MPVRGATLQKEPPRGASLHGALVRLEERFGAGTVLDGRRAQEREAERRIPLGIPSLDALLDGGLAAGEPLVLLGAPSSGTLSLAHRAAAAAQSRGGEVAWLDPSRSFDPLAASRAGIDLDRLLLLRVGDEDVHFTAATVARSAAFVLLVVDLGPFARASATDALGPVVAQARASSTPVLLLGLRRARLASPSLEVRRVDWLRRGGKMVGWRSRVTRAYRAAAVSLTFEPLALSPKALIEEEARRGVLVDPAPARLPRSPSIDWPWARSGSRASARVPRGRAERARVGSPALGEAAG